MPMRKLLLSLLTICLTLRPIASKADTRVTPKDIQLGFIAPLTGPFPDWGESIRRGVEIALLDTKHKFSVNYQDDACQAKQAITIAQKFFSVEKIKYVIGPGCDHTLLAVAPIAAHADAILFSTGLLGEDVFASHRNIINFATQISAEAKRLAREINAEGIKKLAIVHGTNTFGEEYNSRLSEAVTKAGGEVFSEATDLGTTDFHTIIARILAHKPEALFIHQGNSETLAFIRQLREVNLSIPVFSYYSIENESFLNAGRLIEGITYSFPINISDNSDRKLRFDQRFTEKFGVKAFPSATSYYVYDGLMLLDKAFDSCSRSDSFCVLEFFHKFGKYQGISGEMSFRADGGNERTYGIKRVVDGKFAWISAEP
jgi:branched-chain amino acid transport system substrate-binding protein